MLLLKNPQFLPNHYKTWSKQGTHGYLILTKFRKDWVKIVDFPIKAYDIQPCQICFVVLYKGQNLNFMDSKELGVRKV